MIWEPLRKAINDDHLCINFLDFELFAGDKLLDLMISHLNVFLLGMMDWISNELDRAL
mgnify:CR=1 FL=1